MENPLLKFVKKSKYVTVRPDKVDGVDVTRMVVKADDLDKIAKMYAQADKEESQKCKDSPVYFYNKYVRKEGQRELTEAEYEDFIKQVEYQRNMPSKLRSHYKDRPLTPDQCYEKNGIKYDVGF